MRDGWFELNERRVPLNLAVEAFDCSIQYQPSPHSYAVRVSLQKQSSAVGGTQVRIRFDCQRQSAADGIGDRFV